MAIPPAVSVTTYPSIPSLPGVPPVVRDPLASGELKGWLQEATKAAKLFFDEAGKVVEQLGGWKVVLEGLIALKIVSMVAPIMSLAGATIETDWRGAVA